MSGMRVSLEKLKGPPLHNFIQTQEVILVDKLPLSVIMESAGLANKSHTLLDQMLEQHLGQMQNDLSITNMKLNVQKQAIMGIIIGSIAIITLLVVGAYIIKLMTTVIYGFCNKLECLSSSSLSSLI